MSCLPPFGAVPFGAVPSGAVPSGAVPSGAVPSDDLDRVMARVAEAVGYLRIATDAPAGQGWIECRSLITEPRLLGDLIRSTAAGRGARVETVAASLFVQAYAFRIASAVLAPYALGLASPGCRPESTHIRIARDRPASVAVTDGHVDIRSVDRLAQELLGGHLAPLVTAVTETFTIGRRLLLGNCAASIATVLRAIDGASGADRAAVQQRASDFFEAARPWLHGLGEFEFVADGHHVGWYWTRTNCCLWYQCEGATRCDDCSLHTPVELDRIRRGQLEASVS